MKLEFLGQGACFYPQLYNTSAYFIHNNNLILLDCGESVYERLVKKLDINQYSQIYVLITHLHADHVGSLGSLISYCYCILKRKIIVIHPQETLCKLLTLMGIADKMYTYQKKFTNDLNQIIIKEIEVKHAQDMKCYAYLIKTSKENIYYSGDSSNIPKNILNLFFNRQIHKIYQDTSSKNSNHPSHLYMGKLESLIPLDLRKYIYCMHLDCDCKDILKSKGFSIAGE